MPIQCAAAYRIIWYTQNMPAKGYKQNRKPSIKQKRAIQAIVTGQANTIRSAMLQAGYTPASANKNTDLITKSAAYKAIIEEYGITLPSISKRHSELLKSEDESIAIQAVNIGYKVHGVYEQSTPKNQYNAPILIQVNPPKDHPQSENTA